MRFAFLLPLVALAGCQAKIACGIPFADEEIVVLGAAQDGGMPHLGCDAEICRKARRYTDRRARVSSLGVRIRDHRWWLFDATPDLPAQIHEMGGLPAGIFLTHAHIGHYTGLIHLGKEVAATTRLPVYCTSAMAAFLRDNEPWASLVRLEQIELHELAFDEPVRFVLERPFDSDEYLEVTPWQVPHRDELSDTVAYHLRSPSGRTAVFCPDIDRWEEWDRSLVEVAQETDYLFLDGSFWSGEELPGRDMSQIPHPTVQHTLSLLEPLWSRRSFELVFIHHNHTNPLWDPRSKASQELARRGALTAIRARRFAF